ncbi:unnamed protein product [Didymodactylos carnosus]|uniref:Uncharacterized protein n=1 Tax=Didymodactylos carnosus TaxID=1234261 RepID=A0A814HFV1_9BILA|nr:unnamed protein product [Didymodactylos carnosus]CAF3780831.1 unnamed protein product [Didymodactylos carnosus]
MELKFVLVFCLSSCLFYGLSQQETANDLTNGVPLLNHKANKSDGYYRIPNYDFKCLRRLEMCPTGWSLRMKLKLNQFPIVDKERKYLLLSTGAHEPHGDGLLVQLYQSKNTSYLEFGIKEFRNDQFGYYWQLEADLETNQWIDVVIVVSMSESNNHRLNVHFDGYLYRETQVENYTELFVFKYNIHPTVVQVYANNSGLAIFDQIQYYERILSPNEIADVSYDLIEIGCLKPKGDRFHQYIIAGKYKWKQCRDECFKRKTKIALYNDNQCGCIQSFYELQVYFKYDKCTCDINSKCEQWHILSVSHVIDLIDAEVGLEIGMADASFLQHGRTRIQINEGVEIIVSVKNERNLAALTVYGDIEGNEGANSSNEIYITAGVGGTAPTTNDIKMNYIPNKSSSKTELTGITGNP